MLTCTCGVVDTEPVALGHLIAFQAAEEKLLVRHGCAIFGEIRGAEPYA